MARASSGVLSPTAAQGPQDSVPASQPPHGPEALRQLDVESAAESSAASGYGISYAAVPGHPGHVLIEAANDADLLVVASRGSGGFLGLHLGSVTNYCINHARCPVAVIPVHKAAHGHRHGPLSSVAR